ncbi:DUF2271 domain-containing protein [Planctomycetes bacterium K23_9]|uniref:Flagellar basal body rod modification protein n=1 Tax=Stieleria marina TaxID=1930275 RepID=A0A517NWS6_9BACT|nr:flagellar basal body rod modification protein [Planctomycetes bacterium K23_9]
MRSVFAVVGFLLLVLPTPSIAETRAAKATKTSGRMVVEVEINRPDASRRYRKPYVAVWVEDKDRFPVKTIALWLMKNNPGPRWHPDLRQWYKSDRMRLLVEDESLIDGMSGATRSPGKYKFAWDGTDNDGKVLPPGEYMFYVESAREHGTYQLIKESIELGKPFKKSLSGNNEIKSVRLDYQTGASK